MKKLAFSYLDRVAVGTLPFRGGGIYGRLAAPNNLWSIAGRSLTPRERPSPMPVTLTNLATTEKRVAQSGADGPVRFRESTASRYSIVAEKTGFKRITRPEVVVEVGQSVRIDITLQVGDVSQTIRGHQRDASPSSGNVFHWEGG